MPSSFAEYRLPPGRHSLSPEEVAENQRWRLIGAAAELVAERGYLRVTASEIAGCAGVSRTTFYEHFDDLPSCLLAAYETSTECVVNTVAMACGTERDREARLRAAIDAVLEFLLAEPAMAALLGSELAAGVPLIAAARADLIARIQALLAGSANDDEDPASPTSSAEGYLIATALSTISARIAAGDVEGLSDLAPALVEILCPR